MPFFKDRFFIVSSHASRAFTADIADPLLGGTAKRGYDEAEPTATFYGELRPIPNEERGATTHTLTCIDNPIVRVLEDNSNWKVKYERLAGDGVTVVDEFYDVEYLEQSTRNRRELVLYVRRNS